MAGAAPNWPSLGFFIALIGFGGGGNLVLDTTVFLEYLPSNKAWVVTLLACWWGFGQAITGFIAWGFLGTSVTDRWSEMRMLTSEKLPINGTARRPPTARGTRTGAGDTPCSPPAPLSWSCQSSV